MAGQPDISQILAKLGKYTQTHYHVQNLWLTTAPAAQRPTIASMHTQPSFPQQAPSTQSPSFLPPPIPASRQYSSLPQPTSSGSVDLRNIKPVSSGSVSLADALAQSRSIDHGGTSIGTYSADPVKRCNSADQAAQQYHMIAYTEQQSLFTDPHLLGLVHLWGRWNETDTLTITIPIVTTAGLNITDKILEIAAKDPLLPRLEDLTLDLLILKVRTEGALLRIAAWQAAVRP